MRHSLRIQAGAWACELFRWGIEQGAGQRRRGGGVADAHLAADEELGASELGAFGRLSPPMHGACKLLLVHGRLSTEVGGAGSNRQV